MYDTASGMNNTYLRTEYLLLYYCWHNDGHCSHNAVAWNRTQEVYECNFLLPLLICLSQPF